MSKKRCFTIGLKLEVVKCAEENNNSFAAEKFHVSRTSVQDWRRLKDKIVSSSMAENGEKRKRVVGGGTKLMSDTMEHELVDFILYRRSKGFTVSRSDIQREAKRLFSVCDDAIKTEFKASGGWLNTFMTRNNFSMRRKTSVAQRDPDQRSTKIASFIIYVARMREKYNIQASEIIAMDETSIFFDMAKDTTVERKGMKTVSVKTTGHEKDHVTVVLAAKGDGVKLKPYIVFKGAVREVKQMQSLPRVVVTSNKKGWMDDTLTMDWLDKIVVAKPHFSDPVTRLLVWDAFRCHLSESTRNHLSGFNTKVAVIPGGCTKYIQAPDVSWNRPFKAYVQNLYSEWISDEENMSYTKGGNLKAPPRSLIVDWITQAWDSLSTELIVGSFKSCALTTDPQGGEDHEIHCIKEGQPCREAWNMLINYRDDNIESLIQPLICEAEDGDDGLFTIYDSDEN